MAERRMFAKSLVESDGFLDLEAASQALYFHLALQADDEGFINAPRRVLRMLGAREENLAQLVESGLVLRFDSGILAIRHWLVHNQIRNDRRKGTVCRAERELVEVDEIGCYAMRSAAIPEACEPGTEEVSQDRGCEDPSTPLRSAQDDRDGGAVDGGPLVANCQPSDNQVTTNWQPGDNQVTTNWQPSDNQVAAQVRLGKERIDKISIGQDRMFAAPQSAAAAPALPTVPAATAQKDILDIFDAYRQICVGLLPCKKLSQKRQAAIAQALTKRSKEEILALFEKAQAIRFFHGKNNRKWKPGFDWLMNGEHLELLAAGEYDDWCDEEKGVPTGGTGLGDAELEALRKMMGMT